MFFIRVGDDVGIQGKEEIIKFTTHNRKGNMALSFRLKDNDLQFFNSELNSKMIPKNERGIFDTSPLYILMTKNTTLVFQDPNNICKFLVFDDDDGIIKPTIFTDLTEDDSILIYDDPNDYVIDEITGLYIDEYSCLPEDKEVMPGNYVVYSTDSGVIIEDIFII